MHLTNLRKINHALLLELKVININFKNTCKALLFLECNMHYFFFISEKMKTPIKILTAATKLITNLNKGLVNKCPNGTS